MSAPPQRRLAAIVSTDVVGYSRLIGEDEAGTLARMKAHRAELWSPEIERQGGRIVGTAGDSLLVEFASAVAAVACALAVQHGMAEREAASPEHRRMLLRVGVNIGEVVVDGDDIYGDGVNVAARLQALAPPGGILISGKVQDEIAGKVDAAFEDIGPHEMKNIARPVQVWRWAATVAPGHTVARTSDKPSIAVLAFTNMSGDPDQEFFSDGIAEDIITALSKFRAFDVIARNSTFTYKGRAIDIKRVGGELGVRYVLEGSVRKGGNRVRVSAQLIDAGTGNHVWAERYDRELTDIFELQDEITGNIVAATEVRVHSAEVERAARKAPQDMAAWEYYQRGRAAYLQATVDSAFRAQELLETATRIDPDFSLAHSTLAWAYVARVTLTGSEEAIGLLQSGLAAAERALVLDPDNTDALTVHGRIMALQGKLDLSISSLRRAIVLNPNAAFAHFNLGQTYNWAGRSGDAIEHIDHALRLSPRDPLAWAFHLVRSLCLSRLERAEDAIEAAELSLRDGQHIFWPHLALAIACCTSGDLERARTAITEAKRVEPKLSLSFVHKASMNIEASYIEETLEKLRRAGLEP